MAASSKPDKMTLRAYQMGFGDCFLLTFHYKQDKDRHILIDFGRKGKTPKGYKSSLMVDVANDIKSVCNNKLDAVVVTHRHQDHISGFTTNTKGNGSGDIIASCQPRVVIQPWTEHPLAKSKDKAAPGLTIDGKAFVQSLSDMHMVADAALAEVEQRRRLGLLGASDIQTVADNNTKNPLAVENLYHMTKSHYYVYYGSRSGLEKILPGVNIRVLGPPTIEQAVKGGVNIQKETQSSNEFWALQNGAGQFVTNNKTPFRHAQRYKTIPPHARWFVNRMRAVRGNELLGLVHALDGYMNNTSIILLFTIGKTKLLFPGDAQIENWSYALSQEGIKELLSGVNFYKVGHHGSTNATPREGLWKHFKNKGPSKKLQTVVSTMPGVYPGKKEGSEVPRAKLITELKANSNYYSTESLKKDKLCEPLEVKF
jgi:ribonuclease BN (tRNA processing enzyme)